MTDRKKVIKEAVHLAALNETEAHAKSLPKWVFKTVEKVQALVNKDVPNEYEVIAAQFAAIS
eukprot:Stramenopile-MAST_4_protein_5378